MFERHNLQAFMLKKAALNQYLDAVTADRDRIAMALDLINAMIADSTGTQATSFLNLQKDKIESSLKNVENSILVVNGRIQQVDEFIFEINSKDYSANTISIKDALDRIEKCL